jgi:Flp pilus assembly pilin Flp
MKTVASRVQLLHGNVGGVTVTEYIILLVLIACTSLTVVKKFGGTVSKKYQDGNELVSKEVTF